MLFNTSKANPLSYQELLSEIPEEAIIKHYTGEEPDVYKKIKSPFRDENNPSFIFYPGSGDIKWWMRDYGAAFSGSCFDLVMKIHRLSFPEALDKIYTDLSGKTHNVKIKNIAGFKKEPLEIAIKAKDYTPEELEWWAKYNITPEILAYFNVYSCEYYRINQTIKRPKGKFCFGFYFGNGKWKIYQPELPEKYADNKWKCNTTLADIQGYNQLKFNDSSGICFIQKSLKDCMVMRSLGYNAIAPPSESAPLPVWAVNLLNRRFIRTITWYDNDAPGIEYAERLEKLYNIPYITTPLGGPKDLSDYTAMHGIKAAERLIFSLITKT